MLTVVMYHYVRQLEGSRYPRIRGRRTQEFEAQLEHIAAHYQVVGADDVIAAARDESTLPERACLLTFDDGLRDHYEVVLPRLEQRGWSGAFYPPALPIVEHRVLDVHKVHFILASSERVDELVARLRQLLAESGDAPNFEELWHRHAHESRFDPAEVIFVKRVLQHGLAREVRERLVDQLFAEIVSADEAAFSAELYSSAAELSEMRQRGMHIGGHGYRHEWFEHLDDAALKNEVERTRAFVAELHDGQLPRRWSLAYPYGSYDARALAALAGSGCALAFTTEVAQVKDLSRPLALPRLDTNDLPYGATTA